MKGRTSGLSVLALVLVLALMLFTLVTGCSPEQKENEMGENSIEVPEDEQQGENLEGNAGNGETPGGEAPEEPGNDSSLENGANSGLEVKESNSAGNNSGSGNETVSSCWDYQPANMAPKPGWDTVDLEGLTREELVEVLGCPPHIIRMTSVVSAEHNKELWVYHPYEKDPTGLYIWLKGDVFHQSKLDEFNGFWCHNMGDPDFWE